MDEEEAAARRERIEPRRQRVQLQEVRTGDAQSGESGRRLVRSEWKDAAGRGAGQLQDAFLPRVEMLACLICR